MEQPSVGLTVRDAGVGGPTDNPLQDTVEYQMAQKAREEKHYLQNIAFEPRIAAIIVARLAEGTMMVHILEEYGLSWGTIRKWKKVSREFREAVKDAETLGAQKLAEETVKIADEEVYSMQEAARNKLRIDTRLKIASKYDALRYGDKADETGGFDLGKCLDAIRNKKGGVVATPVIKQEEPVIPAITPMTHLTPLTPELNP